MRAFISSYVILKLTNNSKEGAFHMNGTALLINEDNTLTVFENVAEKNVHTLKEEELENNLNESVSVIFCEDAIDWEYGY